ncbi:MAG: radical SAM family heme chaperone HemW, partial [Nitriliruptoraceae bacterium]
MTASRWLDNPVESGPAAGFGIYLHIPFCRHRCGYCDFATSAVGVPGADEHALFDRYIAAVADEIQLRVAAAADRAADRERLPAVTSIFIGGGTPTLVGADRLASLLGRVSDQFDVTADAEITVECNPEDATADLFGQLRAAGVTRLSMGAQSFDPSVLTVLERQHHPGGIETAVALARAAGFGRISLDLIYGTPGESDASWRETLATVVRLGVDHISAYALTVHANTPLGVAVGQRHVDDVDPDVQRDRFDLARQRLADAGFEHYEISNWARTPNQRSRHNVLYWRHGDYLGFGVGAHSHRQAQRWWNTRSTERYLDQVGDGRLPTAGQEQLTADEQALERLMLGLRLREGLHPYDAPPVESFELEAAATDGLVTLSCGRVQCTDDGWFVLDEVVRR